MVIVIILYAAVSLPDDECVRDEQNLYNITRNFTFTAIIALGMTMVIVTGGIDLSVGSVLCFCSMVLAVTMHGDVQFGPTISAPIGLRARQFLRGGCSIYTGVTWR